jgi:hypothetical protein
MICIESPAGGMTNKTILLFSLFCRFRRGENPALPERADTFFSKLVDTHGEVQDGN